MWSKSMKRERENQVGLGFEVQVGEVAPHLNRKINEKLNKNPRVFLNIIWRRMNCMV